MKRFGYEYNKRNLMKKVTDWASRVTNYTYDDAGQLATASYPNSTSIAYTYDNNGQIKDIKYKDSGGSTTHDIAYKRDNLENPTIITDTIGSTTTVKNFTYDDLSQLTDAVYDANNSEAFQYDAVGNRTVLTATVDGTATTTNYSYDEDNRMTAAGTITYTWDNNGDMLSKTDGITTTEYTYDYEKRLTQIADGTNTCQYTYNGDGLRT
ncbi:MAG: hypothetical protein M1319_00345, partial [Chloroflexi bacterium]|nr:hypothetical protein [Chloroflexota bacterium]